MKFSQREMTRRQKFLSDVYSVNKSVSKHSPCPRSLQCEDVDMRRGGGGRVVTKGAWGGEHPQSVSFVAHGDSWHGMCVQPRLCYMGDFYC